MIYFDGATIVCNWSIVCPQENELPRLFCGNPIGWDAQVIIPISEYQVDDWRDEFRKIREKRGITILYDRNGDLICPEGCSAHVFQLDDSTVIIAPDDWN